jgi:hypothetical protein
VARTYSEINVIKAVQSEFEERIVTVVKCQAKNLCKELSSDLHVTRLNKEAIGQAANIPHSGQARATKENFIGALNGHHGDHQLAVTRTQLSRELHLSSSWPTVYMSVCRRASLKGSSLRLRTWSEGP